MSLIAELKRRNVFRVGITYAVASWLLLQVADVLVGLMGLPEWSLRLVLLLVLLGFPAALVFSWIYELTPEGLKKESEIEGDRSIVTQTAKRLDLIVIFLLVVAIGVFSADRFFGLRNTVPELSAEPPKADSDDDVPVVAVLPLKALSTEDEGTFLAAGLHDDLLTRLARLAAYRVISRTSVMEYAETTKNLRQIGEELGAAYIMEGGLQAIGGRVRINAQLIDAASDEHLWAETFDRELTTANLFEVQGEIAAAIAKALHSVLSPHEVEILEDIPTRNLDAYRAYLAGMETQTDLTLPAMLASIEAFRRAVALDPEFGEAWAGLALALIRRYWEEGGETGAAPDEALRDAASEALARAQALNPKSVDTLIAEAFYHYYGFRDYSAALIVLGRAESVAPHHDQVVGLRGFLLRRLGRLGEAADALGQALAANPNDPGFLRETISTLGAAENCVDASSLATRALARYPSDNGILVQAAWTRLFCDHDIEAGRTLMERVAITNVPELRSVVDYLTYGAEPQAAIRVLMTTDRPWGEDPIASLYISNRLAWLYRRTGQPELARESSRTAEAVAAEISQPGVAALAELAMNAALRGDMNTTLALGQRSLAVLPQDAFLEPVFRYNVAIAFAVSGADDEALTQLEILLDQPGGRHITPLSKDPYLDTLRAHPRFQRLIASVNH